VSAINTRIAVRGLTKRFKSARGEAVDALGPIDLKIGVGEFLAIVGPSGCGKSTLLNIAAGFESATEGCIEIDGRAIVGPGSERGVVFQDYALFPWLTVAGNIGFGPTSLGLSPQVVDEKVRDWVKLVRLEGSEQKFPHELSGGMRQRCALARCLANDPDVLLMDEPLAALDALTRVRLQDELLEIWNEASRERPKSALYITHAIDEALYLADRIIVMSERPGRVLREIIVPFIRPRHPEMRSQPEFHRLADEIWRLLRRPAV
jgi:NitT/TauT family transport system ATP-binding protein